jgi:hypothetical protein
VATSFSHIAGKSTPDKPEFRAVITEIIKQRLINFVNWHIVRQVEDLASEQIFQEIFAQQCLNWRIRNDFYPVGGAASYSLMYLLFRLLTENRIDSIVEFGSGQSTILIDRLHSDTAHHVCYEDDPTWHVTVSKQVSRCDYRLCPLEKRTIEGVVCHAYSGAAPVEFDLMLVDGPRGSPQYSRFGCVETIRANPRKDFVIVFDDCNRPGEMQTIEFVEHLLASKGIGIEKRELSGRTRQAILAAGNLRSTLYYV